MPNLAYNQACELLAFCLAGVSLGLIYSIRAIAHGSAQFVGAKPNPFDRVSLPDIARLVAGFSLSILFATVVMFGVGYIILRLSGLHGLSPGMGQQDGFSLLIGILLGKAAHHIYRRMR